MKDTIIKGNGKSRNIKAPTDIPETFAEWRTQLLAGSATLDIGLNAAGCDVVGTALSKANLLSDATKTALGLTGSDPTVNDALYALSRKGPSAEVRVYGDTNTVVTMSRNGKTLSVSVTSARYATFHLTELGDWTVSFTYNGVRKTKVFTLETVGIVYVYPFVVGATLEATSWDTIDTVSKFGQAANYWKVGDTKNITLNGVTYASRIIGFDHDQLTTTNNGRTKAGITFQLVDCTADLYAMNTSDSNTNGWRGSAMRNSGMATLLSQIPTDLRNRIKFVNKVSSVGNNNPGLEITSDKLFLPSEIEIFGSTRNSYPGEGKQYEYYAAGNSTIKEVTGSADYWWERSPYLGNTSHFCMVSNNGGTGGNTAKTTGGVSFCFCV